MAKIEVKPDVVKSGDWMIETAISQKKCNARLWLIIDKNYGFTMLYIYIEKWAPGLSVSSVIL